MKVSDLVDRIQLATGRESLTEVASQAIIQAVNIWENERFWFNEATVTFVTVPDQASYSDSDMGISDAIGIDNMQFTVNGTSYTIRPITYGRFKETHTNPTYTGYPLQFAYYNRTIIIDPTPGATYTCEVSYIKREPINYSTSGSLSLSVSNMWTNEGAELILARAKAILEVDFFKDKNAIQQSIIVGNMGDGCMSINERAQLTSLRRKTNKRVTSGRIRPHTV